MKCTNILELIGNTPIVKYKEINGCEIYIKMEMFNPGGSIKDRAALNMVQGLMNENKLTKNDTAIEATSGNTGIGLALVLACYNIPLIITMPSNASKERIDILRSYGAKVILTEASKGIEESENVAMRLAKENGYVYIDQFHNKYNVEAHKKYTSKEIIRDFDKLDYLVASVGTGGTITGLAEGLKPHYKNIKVVGVEPKESNVLNNGHPGPHGIPGIGAGFVPPLYNSSLVDEVIDIESKLAQKKANEVCKEGLSLGISACSALLAAEEIAKKEKDKIILVIAPDNGSKYVSLGIYDHE